MYLALNTPNKFKVGHAKILRMLIMFIIPSWWKVSGSFDENSLCLLSFVKTVFQQIKKERKIAAAEKHYKEENRKFLVNPLHEDL